MRILVTGATGFIGSHLVRELCAQGEKIRAFVRRQSNLSRLKGLDVEPFFGDATELELAKRAVEGIDVIYHIAGLIHASAGSPESLYWEANVKTTENLLIASSGQAVKSFIFCSSVGVFGPLDKVPADENTQCKPQNIYEKTKYEAEKICLRFFQQKQVPVSIIRPTWVYGPGDARTFKLFKAIANRRFLIIGDGKTMIHPVYVKDLVRGFQLCARSRTSTGKVYIIGGPKPIRLEELIGKISEVLGVVVPSIHLPVWLATGVAYFLEVLNRPFKRQPLLSKRRLQFFIRDQAFDISRSKQELGYMPQVDIEEGLQETLQWYRKERWL